MRGSDRPTCWRVAEAVVDTARHRVLVAGVPRDLEPLSFRLLQFLIEHRDHVAGKQEILTAVWNDTIVSDNALSRAIAQIRRALGDDPKQPRYVKTVPRVGYHLIAEVEAVAPSVVAPSSAGRDALAGEEGAGDEPSLAVLPFANLSADEENEYIADGLAEEILNSLARISELKVVARTSSFAFRGTAQGIDSIAAALRVRYVLEGSVRRSGTRLRVTAQLIDARDGRHLWSERYDREMTDVFAIEDEIGEAISTALRVRLAPPVEKINLDAYQLHLKGRYFLLQLSQEGMAKARACFEQAVAIDPDHAAAHSALAEHHHTVYAMGVAPADTQVTLARAAAEKALSIDPEQGEAHSILAVLANSIDYDWDVAERLHRRALAARPVTSTSWHRFVIWHLLPLGARRRSRRAAADGARHRPAQHGAAALRDAVPPRRGTIPGGR